MAEQPDWDDILEKRLQEGSTQTPVPSTGNLPTPSSSHHLTPSGNLHTPVPSAGTSRFKSQAPSGVIRSRIRQSARHRGVGPGEREALRVLTPDEERQLRDYLRARRQHNHWARALWTALTVGLVLGVSLLYYQDPAGLLEQIRLQEVPDGPAPIAGPSQYVIPPGWEPEPPPSIDPDPRGVPSVTTADRQPGT